MSGESLFKVNRKQYFCDGCKDTGMIIVKGKVHRCELCRNQNKSLITDDDQIATLQEGIVPERFRDMIFDKEKVLNDGRLSPELRKDDMFKYYLDALNTTFNAFNINSDLKYSLLVIGPQGTGKNSFVYSCMNAAIRNGRTVAPYLDSMEINSLMMKNDYEGTLDTLSNADICFIKIPTTNMIGAMRALQIIIDRRARKGLPTIVTSRFTLSYLYNIDSNLENLFIAKNFGDNLYDYGRLRVISSPFPEFKDKTTNKYAKK